MKKSYFLQHPRLGKIYIVPHPTSRKFSARWRNGVLKVIVPQRSSKKNIEHALAQMEAGLLESKIKIRNTGDIVLPDWKIAVGRQNAKPEQIVARFSFPQCELQIGTNINLDSDEGFELFTRAAMTVGKKVAAGLLLPRAKEIAAVLGREPSEWSISNGHQTLGRCDVKGRIALSFMNVFLPPELRDYIICHELAHLTYMNHSEAFHALCDNYLGGKEKELRKRLRNYQWPVKR